MNRAIVLTVCALIAHIYFSSALVIFEESCKREEFQCGNGKCIYFGFRCDGNNDCQYYKDVDTGDTSDEEGCMRRGRGIEGGAPSWIIEKFQDGDEWITATPPLPSPSSNFSGRLGSCSEGRFQCDNGKCISAAFVCDGDFSDCDGDGSDELFCRYNGIAPGSFMGCKSDRAIPQQFVCDGIDNCRDGFRSDELDCQSTRTTIPTPSTTSLPTASQNATPPTPSSRQPMIPIRVARGPIYVGSRVARGTEWAFGDEDGGPSGEGVVKSFSRGEYIVAWDCGTYGFYTASKAYLNPILHKTVLEEGDEVVRGPGWDRSDQDGGEGNIGHVVEKSEIEMVKVRWSSTGEEDWYMGSSKDKHDLLLVRRNPVSGAQRQVTATPPSRLIRGYFTG